LCPSLRRWRRCGGLPYRCRSSPSWGEVQGLSLWPLSRGGKRRGEVTSGSGEEVAERPCCGRSARTSAQRDRRRGEAIWPCAALGGRGRSFDGCGGSCIIRRARCWCGLHFLGLVHMGHAIQPSFGVGLAPDGVS
jgi:hypothetical protein